MYLLKWKPRPNLVERTSKGYTFKVNEILNLLEAKPKACPDRLFAEDRFKSYSNEECCCPGCYAMWLLKN
jgi:hypothetical protein